MAIIERELEAEFWPRRRHSDFPLNNWSSADGVGREILDTRAQAELLRNEAATVLGATRSVEALTVAIAGTRLFLPWDLSPWITLPFPRHNAPHQLDLTDCKWGQFRFPTTGLFQVPLPVLWCPRTWSQLTLSGVCVLGAVVSTSCSKCWILWFSSAEERGGAGEDNLV
jgi:hypothetical protein